MLRITTARRRSHHALTSHGAENWHFISAAVQWSYVCGVWGACQVWLCQGEFALSFLIYSYDNKDMLMAEKEWSSKTNQIIRRDLWHEKVLTQRESIEDFAVFRNSIKILIFDCIASLVVFSCGQLASKVDSTSRSCCKISLKL